MQTESIQKSIMAAVWDRRHVNHPQLQQQRLTGLLSASRYTMCGLTNMTNRVENDENNDLKHTGKYC